jgi:hypothetical protein
MESDVFVKLSRLIATIGRVIVLARLRRQTFILVFVCSLLDVMCHAMDAIEKSLQD